MGHECMYAAMPYSVRALLEASLLPVAMQPVWQTVYGKALASAVLLPSTHAANTSSLIPHYGTRVDKTCQCTFANMLPRSKPREPTYKM